MYTRKWPKVGWWNWCSKVVISMSMNGYSRIKSTYSKARELMWAKILVQKKLLPNFEAVNCCSFLVLLWKLRWQNWFLDCLFCWKVNCVTLLESHLNSTKSLIIESFRSCSSVHEFLIGNNLFMLFVGFLAGLYLATLFSVLNSIARAHKELELLMVLFLLLLLRLLKWLLNVLHLLLKMFWADLINMLLFVLFLALYNVLLRIKLILLTFVVVGTLTTVATNDANNVADHLTIK